jgi:hypothetical protein
MLSAEVETAVNSAVEDYRLLLLETLKKQGFGSVRHETFLKDFKPTGYESDVRKTTRL